MREEKKITGRKGSVNNIRIITIMLIALISAIMAVSCEKTTSYAKSEDDPLATGDVTPPVVNSVLPANSAVSVDAGTSITVTFSEKMDASSLTSSSFTIKQGATAIVGAVSCSGTAAVFKPSTVLTANTLYTGTISTAVKDSSGNALAADYTWSFTTAAAVDTQKPTVASVYPANSATAVPTNIKVNITFSEAMTASTISSSTVTLKKGTTAVAGAVTISGSTATFTPSAALDASSVYTGTVTTGVKDLAGNAIAANYTWSFTTAATADVTAPTVLSVLPVSNATSVAAGTKVTATFSETMDAATISTSTFTLKQGSTPVTGSVSYTGTTATFTPSASLSGSTLYTATISTGVKDPSGNALSANYTWSFTTAVSLDVTAPTVSSVTPANNSTSIAIDAKPTATFSEAMNSGTVTSSTFTLKQGSTSISGTVAYSGTTATFTPSASLTAGTIYTCTITTGAKDLAGNGVASDYSWTFTTAAAATGKSFSADVVPILNLCNTCHKHNWTTSSNASTFYTNLVNSGHVKPAAPTTSKIYVKLSGGHPPSTVSAAQVTTILTWMTEGSKNN